jgi:hypothetical protein
MARNVYFSHGTRNEQYLLEDLIIESISIWGQEMFYIPRTLVGKDKLLGEDRLSQFKNAYPIDMYLESVNGFEGQGAFIQKFGLMMEQSATLTVARRSWEKFVASHNNTTIPTRPCEGDLIYFPLTKGLFEIKFVEHQDPFYQLKKLYVYRLQVELFQYSSELIDTGIREIDVFETLKSFDVDNVVDIDKVGNYGDNTRFREESRGLIFDTSNPFGEAIASQLSYTADSTAIEADTTLTTADII